MYNSAFLELDCFPMYFAFVQMQQQLAAAADAQAEAEARASQAEQQLLQLQGTLTASQEKSRADHLVLAKEIKRLRGEVAALQQVWWELFSICLHEVVQGE
jgi:uncharacterized protein with NAD-binding domain and iron-sulfur cluster